jgi:hypothetical protein
VFTFVETKLFTQLVQRYLPDDEYAALYAKNEADSIPGPVLKKIKEELDGKG